MTIRPGVNPSPHIAVTATKRSTTFWPTTAIVSSTLLWGTWWIPLRQVDALGVNGLWATLAAFSLPLTVLLPMAAFRRRALLAGGWVLLGAGLLVAASASLYAEGLIRGYIARVVLLFYLTPVWSVLLGRYCLSEPITARRTVTIVLGLSGMFVIFGIGEGIPYPRTAAEWMGLISGLCWAMGLVFLRRSQGVRIIDKTIATFLFLGVTLFLLSLIPGGRPWSGALDLSVPLAVWLIGLALVWTFPMIWLSNYGGSGIDPGRVSILLMFEVVVGLTTATLMTDEPFGSREFMGAVLIISAGITELFAHSNKTRNPVREALE